MSSYIDVRTTYLNGKQVNDMWKVIPNSYWINDRASNDIIQIAVDKNEFVMGEDMVRR